MLKIELLQKGSIDRREMYKITSKGLDFLQRYNEIQKVMKAEELLEYERQSGLPKIRHELGELRKAIDNLETDLSNTVNCPKCQASVFSDYRYCPYCGTWLCIEAVKKAAE
jgi:NADH pyrophosphatase NudC (nudix superfamily)